MREKPTKTTIVRTVILAVALANAVLPMFGITPIPLGEGDITQYGDLFYAAFSAAAAIGASLCAWWKNNSFTTAAIRADQALHTGFFEDEDPEVPETEVE